MYKYTIISSFWDGVGISVGSLVGLWVIVFFRLWVRRVEKIGWPRMK